MKMATQLQVFKKNLTKNYIKQGKMPDFTGELEKKKDHRDAFLEYKCSELSIQWVQKEQGKYLEESISSDSRARCLQACKTEIGEDGAGFD